MVLVAFQAIATSSPVPQASLAFPLVVELLWLCVSSFSQLRHWEPSRWRLLGRGYRPVQRARVCTRAGAGAAAPFYAVAVAVTIAAHMPPPQRS
jgi:hypothetical protein